MQVNFLLNIYFVKTHNTISHDKIAQSTELSQHNNEIVCAGQM